MMTIKQLASIAIDWNNMMHGYGAKTQVEATEAIKQALMAQGVAYGTRTYTQAFDKAWKDNDCVTLPMQ